MFNLKLGRNGVSLDGTEEFGDSDGGRGEGGGEEGSENLGDGVGHVNVFQSAFSGT